MADVVGSTGHRKTGTRRIRMASLLLAASAALAGCGGDFTRWQTASPAAPTVAPAAKPTRSTFIQSPAAEKEHERILSSYGGAYDDAKLEALIGKTVDRLVAVSDRPD